MKLKELLTLAQGDRSQNEYALHADVSTAMIGKIKSGERNPSPWTLQKLAKKAQNGVTYEQLMLASGFMPGQIHKVEVVSPKMQSAIDLIKQVDERNLATVIGFLQGAIEMQNEITRRS